MDQYYLDNLPPALLRPDEIQNEDRAPVETKEPLQPLSNLFSQRQIL